MNPTLHYTFIAPETPPERRLGASVQLCPVAAGWPSPAEDYVEKHLDMHKLVVRNPSATFFVYATGDSMLRAGIHEGDLLVVDRSLDARPGKVVIASYEGDLTVKRFVRRGKRSFLVPENDGYPEFEISGREDVCIWGVVTYVLHQL